MPLDRPVLVNSEVGKYLSHVAHELGIAVSPLRASLLARGYVFNEAQ